MRGASQRTAAAALIAASLAVASLLLGLSACVLDAPYDKFAIVYGVADYGGLLSTLLYTDEDADAMQQLLLRLRRVSLK